jgi:hypothetical protein
VLDLDKLVQVRLAESFYVLNIQYLNSENEAEYVTWLFSEKDNGFISRATFNPEDMCRINNEFISFKNGNIWFGTNPVGVCRYDGKSFEWITEEDVTEFRNEGANGVRSITEDKNGDFWFNTEYRYSVYDSTTLKSNKFYTRHKSIGGLDGKTESNLDEYLSTVIDNNSNLWFVTYRDGVWKYDGTKITHYIVQDNSKDITLFSIYKDNNGVLWLGTHENGAYKFNGKTFEKFKP